MGGCSVGGAGFMCRWRGGGKVVHDEEGGREVFLVNGGFGPFHAPANVFAQAVFLDSEVQRRAARAASNAQCGDAGVCITGEEEQLGNTEGTGHGGVVAEFVGFSFLVELVSR